MIKPVPPAAIFITGAFLIPILKGRLKSAYLLLLPVLGFINLINIPEGVHWTVGFLDYELVLGKVDRLSMVFAYIFHIMSFISILYALHVKEDSQHIAAVLYAGAALGVIFAGDLLSFFIFWEIMAVTASCLIWARKTKASYGAGFRYLLVHFFGGLCLLAGIIINVHNTGSIEFGYIGLNGLGSFLIFIGFGLNCAWPGLHVWLTESYPESTVTGTTFLSVFTTKCAVYALARAFPGTEALIWIGAVMTCFPIFYAVIENDLRRVLSYSLVNQIGFMVVGIGIGTELSINGATAHAFADIIFKGLLFMSMGAVMYRTGKINATDLGGLYKSMPLTCVFCIVGAASISAFPLFSAFATKSMVMSAAAGEHLPIIWFMLLFASAGVFHHAGIKIPFFAFFSHDSGIRTKEAPIHMLIAMGLAAFLCIFIGTFPNTLYSILPFPVDYVPYTASHVLAQLQLLFFSALAFTLLILSGIYPAEMRAINLDADWFYRKGASAFMWVVSNPMSSLGRAISKVVFNIIPSSLGWASRNPAAVLRIVTDSVLLKLTIPEKRDAIKKRIEREKEIYPGDIIKQRPIGMSVLLATLFLLLYLIVYY